MDFVAGVAVNLVAETATRTFDSFRNSEDKATEYKDSLANNINLARAITEVLSDAQFTIKNKGLKKWYSDLIVAVDEGDVALQSSAAEAKALKSAASKLKNLTSKANTYLMLFESEKKAAALADCDFLAALCAPKKAALTSMSKMPSFVALGGSRSRNPNRHRSFDLYRMMSLARTLSQSNKLLITGRSVSKNQRRFVKDHKKALTCMGLYPEGTGFHSGTIKDSLCKELQSNRYDNTNTELIYNGEHSINNHMKIKGKCPECEFVEHTGYGDASMPAISCFPSSSSGGVGNHISPSSDGIPEENHGHVGDVSENC